MIDAENSKRKKKRDNNQIADWESQIEDLKDQIADLKQGIIDELSTTDLYTFSNDLASTLIDGLADGLDDGSDLIQGKIDDLIKDIIAKQFDVFVIQKAMAGMFQTMADAFDEKSEDGFAISDKEMNDIVAAGQEGKDQINASLDRYRELLERLGLMNEDIDVEGVTGKLNAAMTEGTASDLVGLWNMTAMDIRSLLNLSVDHFAACRDGWQKVNEIVGILNAIATNTGNTATNTNSLVSKLEQGIKDLKDELTEIRKNTKNYNGRG